VMFNVFVDVVLIARLLVVESILFFFVESPHHPARCATTNPFRPSVFSHSPLNSPNPTSTKNMIWHKLNNSVIA